VKFRELELRGAYVVEVEPVEDERGFFGRSWCEKEALDIGLESRIVQCSISFNKTMGTLRGMHFQARPHEEVKIVRCTRGAIYDVLLDLRKGSPTHGRWTAIELTESNRHGVYVPRGFAHGFQTLEHNTEVYYMMSEFYYRELAGGVRWDDPAFGITWPIKSSIISSRDANFPDYRQS